MTELSEQMKDRICVYCGNNEGGCTANVPYYCVSIWCKFFIEKGAELAVEKKWELSPEAKMRRLIKRTMVETF
ncbi:MAG: hypothetical protein LBB48_01660 [Treponema sp.]|nr:hypothetical protein [Treponema sp.]